LARILVVDDVFDSAWSLSISLRGLQHEVRTADSGRAAAQVARNFLPEFVFIDLFMPGVTGFDVARALREEPATQHIPLVAITGHPGAITRHLALEAGFDTLLLKPVDTIDLRTVIEQLSATAVP
jgi:two-component system cell cycle response regulator